MSSFTSCVTVFMKLLSIQIRYPRVCCLELLSIPEASTYSSTPESKQQLIEAFLHKKRSTDVIMLSTIKSTIKKTVMATKCDSYSRGTISLNITLASLNLMSLQT